MAQNELTRDALLVAIDEFDRVGRAAFLGRYGVRPATGHFVIHNGRRYDARALAVAVHGAVHGGGRPQRDLSGSDSTIAKLIERLGFDIERPSASPAWTMDELILALDLYLSTRGKLSYSPGVAQVVALSEVLRGLRIFGPEVTGLETFRNPSGVALKLHNLAAVDPSHSGKGMSHGSKLDKVVWDLWAHRQAELHQAAELIRQQGASDDAAAETGEDEEFSADEGRLLYRLHRTRERDRKLVGKKRAAVLAATGRLACEVCGLETGAVYGPELEGVIEVHHVVPLHQAGESRTKLSDLAIVCPTCHRVLHRHRPIVTPSQLRERIELKTP